MKAWNIVSILLDSGDTDHAAGLVREVFMDIAVVKLGCCNHFIKLQTFQRNLLSFQVVSLMILKTCLVW